MVRRVSPVGVWECCRVIYLQNLWGWIDSLSFAMFVEWWCSMGRVFFKAKAAKRSNFVVKPSRASFAGKQSAQRRFSHLEQTFNAPLRLPCKCMLCKYKIKPFECDEALHSSINCCVSQSLQPKTSPEKRQRPSIITSVALLLQFLGRSNVIKCFILIYLRNYIIYKVQNWQSLCVWSDISRLGPILTWRAVWPVWCR